MALLSSMNLIAGLSATIPLLQGDSRQLPPAQDASSDRISLEKLCGAEVQLEADAAARREAREENDVPDAPTAKIVDLIMTDEGQIEWAALSVGGILGIGDRVVLVGQDRLRHGWQDDEPRCTLSMTKDELSRLPEFKRDAATKPGGLDAAIRVVEAAAPRDGRADEAGGDLDDLDRPRYLLAREFMKMDIHGVDGRFGTISDGVVDPRHGEVSHWIVSRGGLAGMGDTLYIVPLGAAQLVPEEDDDWHLALTKTVADLEQAVRYERPSDRFVLPSALQLADEFFGIKQKERPKHDASRDKVKHEDARGDN